MADFDTMVDNIQVLVGSHSGATDPIVGGLVNKRHRALLESYEWSRKKQEIIISTATDYSTGTVTMTNGDATVTGSSTVWTSGMVDRYINVGNELYVIGTFTSSTSIEIKDLNGTSVTFPGTTTASLSYVIFQRWHSLTAGVEDITTAYYNNSRIYEVDMEYLDRLDPKRAETSGTPKYFAKGPRDQSSTNDLVRIELWPRPSSAIAVQLSVRLGHTTLSGTTNPIAPSGPVEWAAAVDTCYYLFAKTKDQKYLALVDKYNIEFEKSFEREKVLDAKKFGLSPAVKDKVGGISSKYTDFGVDHDTGIS